MEEKIISLIKEKSFGHLALVDKDGYPHVTPVWVDTDGEHVLVNTAVGRKKQVLAKPGEKVTIEVSNPSNPYRYAMIKGVVVKQTRENAEEHIDYLAKKYMGVERYPRSSKDEKRVIIYIKPEKILSNF